MALTYLQRSYAGGASAGTLLASIGSGTTSFSSSSSLSGWTDITGLSFAGNIVVAVEYGTANEEKILCTFNGTAFTIVSRNYDGTNFSGTHAAGSTFVLVYTAEEAAEANDVVQTMKTILTNTGTATTPANITVDGTASVGTGQTPAAIDHSHVIPSTSLSTWLGTATVTGTNLSIPAANLTSGVLPTGVTASKVFQGTTSVTGITGYNNYMIVATATYRGPTVTCEVTQSLTVNGATGKGTSSAAITTSGQPQIINLTSTYAYAITAATTFSVTLAVSYTSSGSATVAYQNIQIIGYN